jgi:putative ABC transport system permease protein
MLHDLRDAARGLFRSPGFAAVAILTLALLFGVTPTDPLTFGLVVLLLAGVSVMARWIPARRATRIAPLVALRAE